jgi:uncharacterized protein (TIGR03437 family)
MPMHRKILLCLIALAACLAVPEGQAAIQLRRIASGFEMPLYVTSAKDGSGRLFVVEQRGRIRIVANGQVQEQAFLDITDRIKCCGEMGLLGLAFHPNFRNNGRLFVNYTRAAAGFAGETVIAEYTVAPGNPNVAVKESERIVLSFPQPFENHNGGMVEFGADGFLYIATGDGGSGGDPMGNGQSLNTLLGKILRIDVDSTALYAIPADNPFVNAAGLDEIFAYGLRNPFRFSFDRETGRLFAGDVGQVQREEVDIIVKGGNYGWNIMEGTLCFRPSTGCNRTGLILPIHDYPRSEGTTVTGGYVYRGSAVPSLAGKYVYADFGSGTVWALRAVSAEMWSNETLLETGRNISSFGEDEAGELYVADYAGELLQIASSTAQPAIHAGGIVNAASYAGGSVAPGELIAIFGSELGPGIGAGAQLDENGRVAQVLGDTRVWFDDQAAPLLFVRNDQINVQAPYGVAGKQFTVVRAQVGSAFSNAITLPVVPAAPGIFALAGGRGQGAILNSDLSFNSSTRPAARGSIAVFYATGEGQTSPSGVDGALAAEPYPTPLLGATITIGGIPAEIIFAGSAPGFAGLMQINARVPQQTATGSAVPVVLRVGNAVSQSGLTMAVN